MTRKKMASVHLKPIGAVIFFLCGLAMIFYFTTGGGEHIHKYEGKTVSVKALLSAAISLAEKGGRIVKKIREASKNSPDLGEQSKGQTAEGANDPLTQGDMQSHRAIVYGFKKLFPNLEVVSEEKDRGNVDLDNIESLSITIGQLERELQNKDDEVLAYDEILVWVDPLDATQEYTEDLKQYVTTMVCIAIHGKPVVGVIHQPFNGKTHWAWVGHGMSEELRLFNNERKESSNSDSPRIIVSRSHAGRVNETARQAFGERVQVLPAGGAGFKTLSVLKGEVDAYVHVTLIKKWDICAGNALINAKNGHMTNLKGHEIDYSDGKNALNPDGLLVTMTNHNKFKEKLSHIEVTKRKHH